MKISITNKKIQINKAQSAIMVTLIIAVVVSVFSLISAKRLWSQAAFQRHVISSRRDAAKTLADDVAAAGQLSNNYATIFANINNPANVIGGKNTTNSSAIPPDGDNARIVLNALPINYDFPALISSITKIMTKNAIADPGISGSDQSATTTDAATGAPAPVPINLSINATGTASQIKRLIRDLERSTRPFDITNMQLQGTNSNMSLSLNMTTYFQPATTLTIGTKEVK